MGTVAQEAKRIRELLEEHFGTGGGGLTPEQLLTVLAALAEPVGLRAAPAGQATGLYVPLLAGEAGPAAYFGGAGGGVVAPAIVAEVDQFGPAIQASNPTGPALYLVSGPEDVGILLNAAGQCVLFATTSTTAAGAVIQNAAPANPAVAATNGAGGPGVVGQSLSGPGVRARSVTGAIALVVDAGGVAADGTGIEIHTEFGPVPVKLGEVGTLPGSARVLYVE